MTAQEFENKLNELVSEALKAGVDREAVISALELATLAQLEELPRR